MGKLEPFDKKQTTWQGLWWHPENCAFTSAILSLADIRKFKGKVRLIVKKNKFFNNGENGKPNYNFCLKDANSDIFQEWAVEDDEDENGERLYTRDEVRTIINGVFSDVQYGFTDPYDLLPEDYVS